MTTLHLRRSIDPAAAGRSLLLVPLVLVCLALSPMARAVSPAPDGGYGGFNTAEGQNPLLNLTSGVWNTGLGGQALHNDTTGSVNTAVGLNAMYFNTGGGFNVAVGAMALEHNNANGDIAIGYQAAFGNSTGFDNTAVGFQSLFSNTTGTDNTAVGWRALVSNTTIGLSTGHDNTAVGSQALLSNTIGGPNTAIGFAALSSNTEGGDNTAIGVATLFSNTTGGDNTAVGDTALFNNTGGGNTALGDLAGANLTTGSHNVDIANTGVAGESGTIRIGGGAQTATFIAGINGVDQGVGTAVFINTTTGQLGTAAPASSRRFKKEIKPMDQTSDAILALKPVTFQYKSDTKGTPQFGLIAEEVAQVNPDLVVRDDKGEIYTVRYDAVNAMLLNEFLKQHHQVQDLKTIVAEQQKQIKALTSGLEKVNNQLELNKPAPRTVSSNR